MLSLLINQIYEPIQKEMEQVKARYQQELHHPDASIHQLLGYIEGYSGKMLRPALLLLSAKACGEVTEDHICLAVVSELLHTATLVHDDILDDAETRRQRASINQLSGNEISVLLGDYLFSHALELALSLDDPAGARHFSRAISRTCLGEITQVFNRENFELKEEVYYQIIRGKTAELYATSAELGPLYAGTPQHAQSMYNYGMNLGLAFQIMDDLLDLRGDEATVGKSLGRDLAKGKLTLPVIHYLENSSSQERATTLQFLEQGTWPDLQTSLLEKMEAQGSLEYAENQARSFVADAQAALAFLKGHPMGDFFSHLADFIITREL